MDRNIQDAAPQAEAKAVGLNGLGDFSMKDFAIFNQINEQMSKNLGDTLPAMTLYSNDGGGKQAETRKAPPGEKIVSEDLKEGKVNASRKVEDGRKSTSAEYPNGVGLKVKEGARVETVDGKFVVSKPEAEIAHNGNLKQKGNSYYDENGKEIIKRNADGTFTVSSGDDFFKQGPNGIEKVHAIRNRDGSFSEINVKDPLGDLRPSDPTAKKR